MEGETAEADPRVRSIAEVFGDLPKLETGRLVLRRLRADDAPAVFAYASDHGVARTVTWEAHRTIGDSEAFIADVLRRYAEGDVAPWGVTLAGDDRVIGTCGYQSWSLAHARAEIGYALAREHWNRGLMTEAVAAAIGFGFERMGLHRVEARCLPENVASARVMEKNGITCEGTMREVARVKGEWRNLHLYSILRDEWLQGRNERRGAPS